MLADSRRVPPSLWLPPALSLLLLLLLGLAASVLALWAAAALPPTLDEEEESGGGGGGGASALAGGLLGGSVLGVPIGMLLAYGGSLLIDWLAIEPLLALWRSEVARRAEEAM